MRGRTFLMAMAATLGLVLGACGPADEAALDETGTAELDQADDGKADTASSTSTYYRGRHDTRKCMFPLCGGVWVRRVNFPTTKCLDGKYAAECYVAEVKVLKLALSSTYLDDQVKTGFEAGSVLLRGSLATATLAGKATARFTAKEAWMAAAAGEPAAGDLFYRASDSGIRCVKAPCPSVHLAKLNSTVASNVDGNDLTAMPGTDADRDAAGSEVMTKGLLLAAHTKQVSATKGKLAITSQAYRRVVPAGAHCGGGTVACGPAQKCCYPCGIPGCKNVCMAVDSCPLIP